MGPVSAPGRTPLSVRARAFGARAGRWLSRRSYLTKWIVLGGVIGVIAGLGAVVFFEALQLSARFFLGVLVGFHPGAPVGEGGLVGSAQVARPWLLPAVTGFGALLGALLVFRIAPEAEGHGTDAAIYAVHHNPRGIRTRAVLVKIVASALTIGSGGSGGREGPAAQISAGFGSLLSRVLDLDPADSRTAVATGIGAGIGAIFGAPLGGAVLASEILYRDDFDVTALLPCFIASVVSFSVFGAFEGWLPLFGYVGGYQFSDPVQLLWFALIGVLGGLVGLLYAKSFYGLAGRFARLPVPRWLGPAIGGVLVGLMGLVIPQVLGTGYGWVQLSLGFSLLTLPLWVVLILPFAKILATGLSIGSGGSGGIFGPGMVIGAFLGAGVWRVFEPLSASMGHNPAPYVIVGMMCCFGGISRAPLALMLMVAEMTGSLSMLAPAMIAVGISWLIVRRVDATIYRSQLRNRAEAPAQRVLVGLPLLSRIPTARAMMAPRLVLDGGVAVADAGRRLRDAGLDGAPVVDEEARFEGSAYSEDLEVHPESDRAVQRVVDPGAPSVSSSSRLDVALEALQEGTHGWISVLDDDRRVVGTLSVSDLVRAYRRELQASFARLVDLDADTAAFDVTVAEASPVVGMRLRSAHLPQGVLVTSIAREGSVILPTGDTVLQADDRLSVLGSREGMEVVGSVSGTAGPAS
jgi:chloride channel protein, CIC family